ncbi:hypothetical protein BDZ88DRAFT_324228 [Geranomyces variabilis]|nr:hypothetical protein BDZ88DRAFT_324228 [Geranomyces variabilis]KAJ3142477.1 hypothetical protein HDU90_004752 [Geranomyces variabilis]
MDQDGQRSYLSSHNGHEDFVSTGASSDHDTELEQIPAGISEEEFARFLRDMDAELEGRGPGQTDEQTSDDDPVDAYGFPLSERPSRKNTLDAQGWATSGTPGQQNDEMVKIMGTQDESEQTGGTYHPDSPSDGYEEPRVRLETHVNAIEEPVNQAPAVANVLVLEQQPSAQSVFLSAREEGSEASDASGGNSEDDGQSGEDNFAGDTDYGRSTSFSQSDGEDHSAEPAQSGEMREQAAAVPDTGAVALAANEAEEHGVDASQDDELLSSRPTSEASASEAEKNGIDVSQDGELLSPRPTSKASAMEAEKHGVDFSQDGDRLSSRQTSEASAESPLTIDSDPLKTAHVASEEEIHEPASESDGPHEVQNSSEPAVDISSRAETSSSRVAPCGAEDDKIYGVATTPMPEPSEPTPAVIVAQAAPPPSSAPLPVHQGAEGNFFGAPFSFETPTATQMPPAPFVFKTAPQNQTPFAFGAHPLAGMQKQSPFVFGTTATTLAPQSFSFGTGPKFDSKPAPESSAQVAPEPLPAVGLSQQQPAQPAAQTQSRSPFVFNFSAPAAGSVKFPVPAQVFAFGDFPQKLSEKSVAAPGGLAAISEKPSPTLPLADKASEATSQPDQTLTRDLTAQDAPREVPEPVTKTDVARGLLVLAESSHGELSDSPAPPQVAEKTRPDDISGSEPTGAEHSDGEGERYSSEEEGSEADGEGSAESESDHENQDGNASPASPDQTKLLAAPPPDPDPLHTELQSPVQLTTTSAARPEATDGESEGSEGSEDDGEDSAESESDNELEQDNNTSAASQGQVEGFAAPSLDPHSLHIESQPAVALNTTSAVWPEASEGEADAQEGSDEDGEDSAESDSISEHGLGGNPSRESSEQAEASASPSLLDPEHADLQTNVPLATLSVPLPEVAEGGPEVDVGTDGVAEETSVYASDGQSVTEPQAMAVTNDAVVVSSSAPQQAESDSKVATEQVSPPVTDSARPPQEAETEQSLESESDGSLQTASGESEPESDEETASDANEPPAQASVEQRLPVPSIPPGERANLQPAVSREAASGPEVAEEGAAPAVADVGVHVAKETLASETTSNSTEVVNGLPAPKESAIAPGGGSHNPPTEPDAATHAARSVPEPERLLTIDDSQKNEGPSEVVNSSPASSHAKEMPIVSIDNDLGHLQTESETNTAGLTQKPDVLRGVESDEEEVEESVGSGSDEEFSEDGESGPPGPKEARAASIDRPRDLHIDPGVAGPVEAPQTEQPAHDAENLPCADSGDDEDEDEDLESQSDHGVYAHVTHEFSSPPHSTASLSIFPSSGAPIALPQASPLSLPLQPTRAARPSLPYILTTRPTTTAQSLSSDPDELFSDCDQGEATTDRSRSLSPQPGRAASRARSLSRSSAGQRSPSTPRSPLQKLEHVLKSPFVRAGILADSSGDDEDDDEEGRHYSDAEQGEDSDESAPIQRTPVRSSSPILPRAPSPLPSLTLPLPYAPTHSRRPSTHLSVSTTGLFAPIDEALLPLSPPPTAPLSKLQRLEYALMSPINTLLHRENRGHDRRASDEGVAEAIGRHGKPAIPRSRSRVGELIHYFSTLSAGQDVEENEVKQEDENRDPSASAHLLSQIRGDEDEGEYEIEPHEDAEDVATDDVYEQTSGQHVLAAEHGSVTVKRPKLVQSPLDASAVELPLPAAAVAIEAGGTESDVQAAVPNEAPAELNVTKVDPVVSRDATTVDDSPVAVQSSSGKGSEAGAAEIAAPAATHVETSNAQQKEPAAAAALPAEPVAAVVLASPAEPPLAVAPALPAGPAAATAPVSSAETLAAAANALTESLAADAPALSDEPAAAPTAATEPLAGDAQGLSDQPAAAVTASAEPLAADAPALSDEPAAAVTAPTEPLAADAPALSDDPPAAAVPATELSAAVAPAAVALPDGPNAAAGPELSAEPPAAVTDSEIPAKLPAAAVLSAEPEATARALSELGSSSVVPALPAEPVAAAAPPSMDKPATAAVPAVTAEPVVPVATPAASVAEVVTPKPAALAAAPAANHSAKKVLATLDCTRAIKSPATAATSACACLPHLRLRNAELRSELHHARLALTAALATAAERAPPAWRAQVECAAAEAEAARAGRAMWDDAVEGEWEYLRERRKGERVSY